MSGMSIPSMPFMSWFCVSWFWSCAPAGIVARQAIRLATASTYVSRLMKISKSPRSEPPTRARDDFGFGGDGRDSDQRDVIDREDEEGQRALLRNGGLPVEGLAHRSGEGDPEDGGRLAGVLA